MMIRGTFLVLCVVAFTCRGAQLPQPRDVFDDADDVLEKYRYTVATILVQVGAQIRETQGKIQSTGQAVNSIAVRIIGNAQTEFLGQLYALDEVALAQGVDPQVCTYGAKRDISRWPYGLMGSINTCVNEIIRESNQILTDAFSNFDHLESTIDDFATSLEGCRSAEDIICTLSVVVQIELQTEMLPILLDNDIREVLSQFDNIELNFQTCSSGPVDEMYVTGRIIVASASLCIDNLISK